MTPDEAINILNNDVEICTPNQEKAVDMAVKALEQQPCEDCISRKAVIQILDNKLCPCNDMFGCLEMSEIKGDIEQLPPVIPKIEDNEEGDT